MSLRDNIRWVVALSRGYRLQLTLNIVLGVASVELSLLFIYLSKSLVDQAVEGGLQRGLLVSGAIIGCVLLTQQGFNFIRSRTEIHSSTKMMNELRERLFFRVMMGRWSGRENFHTGDITTRLDSDTRKVCEALCTTIPTMIITSVEFLLSFLFLMALDSRLAWMLLIIMPVSLLVSKRYMLRLRSLTHSIREMDSQVQSHIQEQVQHRTTINSMGQTSASLSSLRILSGELLGKTMHRANYTLYSRAVVRLGFSAGYLTVFLWGVNGLSNDTVTFGVMTAFLQLVAKIQLPIVELSTYLSTIAQSTSSVERLHEIEKQEIEEHGEPRIVPGAVGIRLKDVTFGYGEKSILSHFDHNFSPHNLHVIVGESGSGKSTMLRLILGFLNPSDGSIEIYNSTNSERCSALTRDNFVYVPQGNTLLSGTIRDNILLGKPTATDAEIAHVIHTSVAEFIYALPDGLDTLCGEQGAGLSEGEAQRIAIARGLLRSGGVMLFDEPTSALDSATEQLLIERLSDYSQNRTVIMVTHRESVSEICTSAVKLTKEK